MRSLKKGLIGAIIISSLSLVFNGIVGTNHRAYAALPLAPEVAGGMVTRCLWLRMELFGAGGIIAAEH